MSGAELTRILVAQYLQKQGYESSLASYLRDSGVSMTSVSETKYEDLESIVRDRIGFGEVAKEKLRTVALNNKVSAETVKNYSIPGWNHQLSWTQVELNQTLAEGFLIGTKFLSETLLATSTPDKVLAVWDVNEQGAGTKVASVRQSGIVKFIGPVSKNKYYTGTIDGKLTVRSLPGAAAEYLRTFDLPGRAVISMEVLLLDEKTLLCIFASTNLALNVYAIDLETGGVIRHTEYKLLSACTNLRVAFSKDGCPTVFLTRQDFTQIMIFRIEDNNLQHIYNIALNTAQFSTHSFNVSDMQLVCFNPSYHETNTSHVIINDRTMIAVATSHTPYMRLILTAIPDLKIKRADLKAAAERTESVPSILEQFMDANVSIPSPTTALTTTHYDMILQNIATVVPQDSYSQPVLRVSHELGGILVGADDGLYAIDLQKSDTWSLSFTDRVRVKSMDVHETHVCVSYASKRVVVWKLR